jgi:hypothetical protein
MKVMTPTRKTSASLPSGGDSASAVLAALAQQVELYRKLAKLAAQQHEHVQLSRIEELLTVLQRRQEVLDQVALLEDAIGPAKRQWTAFAATLDGPSRASAEANLNESRRLLEEITTADRNDALVLQQRKLNVGRQLNQATTARKVNRNIAAAAYGTRGARMDLKQ